MNWIYLSPHFDDAVFSCGGLIWEQTRRGQTVEIWTVCAAAPDPFSHLSPYAQTLHDRWKTGPEAVTARAEEDQEACRRLNAGYHYLDVKDCIYRFHPDGEPVIHKNEDLFDIHIQPETALVDLVTEVILRNLPQDSTLISPLGIGNHLDHRLTKSAAQRVWQQTGSEPIYYAEVPYLLGKEDQLEILCGISIQPVPETITPEGLSVWQEACLSYSSQMSSFWKNDNDFRSTLTAYWQKAGGRLWMLA